MNSYCFMKYIFFNINIYVYIKIHVCTHMHKCKQNKIASGLPEMCFSLSS